MQRRLPMIPKLAGIALFGLLLSGCYTQFSTLEEKRPPPPPQITYEIDSATGDTVKVVRSVDTVMAKQQNNCYWTRNIWGEAELRCDNSLYAHDWYLYNDYPWWYRSNPYYYDYSGRCPRYYYYDATCGCCQYYGGGTYYNYGGRGGYGSSSGTGGNGNVRKTSSSGVPSPSSVRSASSKAIDKAATPAANQKTAQAAPQRRTQADNAAAAVSGAVRETQGESVYVPPMEKNASPPPIEAPRETNQPQGPGSSIQSPPSPPASANPPPSNNEGSGNNDNNRRNPRSW